jgi:hypothetical protein
MSGTLIAQNVHLVKTLNATDAGTTLVLAGKIAGLGSGDVTLIVDATGVASVECTNPGGNVAPGQDTTITASGSVTLPSPKNGQLTFNNLATSAPSVPNTPTCPNNAWTADVIDVAFSGGTLTVIQGGVIVLQTSFSL